MGTLFLPSDVTAVFVYLYLGMSSYASPVFKKFGDVDLDGDSKTCISVPRSLRTDDFSGE